MGAQPETAAEAWVAALREATRAFEESRGQGAGLVLYLHGDAGEAGYVLASAPQAGPGADWFSADIWPAHREDMVKVARQPGWSVTPTRLLAPLSRVVRLELTTKAPTWWRDVWKGQRFGFVVPEETEPG